MTDRIFARLTLFQLAVAARDYRPDGAPYPTKAEAEKAKALMAWERMGNRYDTTEELHDAIDTTGMSLGDKSLDDITELDDLDDAQVIYLAEQEIDFEADIYEVTVEVDVYDLTSAIRAAGAAPVVFTVDDVADRFGGDRAGAQVWLTDNRGNIEDRLSERGNEMIDDLLVASGDFKDADDEPDPDAVKLFVFSGGINLGGPGRGFYYAPLDKDDAPKLGGRADDDALPIWGPFDSIMMAERGARDAFGAERIYFVELDETPDWLPPGY